MSIPAPEGTPLAMAAEVDSLREEIRDLRRQVRELARRASPSAADAIRPLQEGFATLTPEEQASFAASDREARACFERGRHRG